MIIYGDSITHGYDATSPELSYASCLADALCVDAKNKGIGGEIFRPELAKASNTENVKYISVAYGTNDWGACTREVFESNCRAFYETLSAKYPDATIFALTPVWRKHWLDTSKSGKFYVISDFIERLAGELPNVKAVSAIGFIPADLSCFSPDGVHPNDKGFGYYAEGTVNAVKKILGE
jgi:lysophospholipase L1-like esterase